MLRELWVEHLALIDHLHLQLSPGLTAISGETGAGKSILLGALDLLLGARGGPDIVRQGETQARLVMLCDPPEPWPMQLGTPPEELLITREIETRRSTFRINDRPSTAQAVRDLCSALIDLSGQGENYGLQSGPLRRRFLDQFAQLQSPAAQLSETYEAWEESYRQLSEWPQDAAALERELDLLTFEIKEIEELAGGEPEEQTLRAQERLLASRQRLESAVALALSAIWQGLDEGPAAHDLAARAAHALSEASTHDEALTEPANMLSEAVVLLEETAHTLRHYIDKLEQLDLDPQELAQRLEAFARVHRKYGSWEDIAAHLEAIQRRREQLSNANELREQLLKHCTAQEQAYRRQAISLSQARQQAAEPFARVLENLVRPLGMPDARVQVQVRCTPDAAPAREGLDTVEIMFSANLGEPMRCLQEVASGGERARLFLALRQALGDRERVPTIVFDEIDEGLGGQTAHLVATALRRLSQHHQVLVVTHQAAIAAAAHQHIKIWKETRQGRTYTRAEQIDGQARLAELARMLGDGPTAKAHAEALLTRFEDAS